MALQSLIRAIYPPQCVGCDAATDGDDGLCAACWRATSFILGTCCDLCGAPLPGDGDGDDAGLRCDDCMTTARPWDKGRAALVYAGKGRSLVLGLKHGDRTDLARPAARWMAARGAALISDQTVLVPVPLHWTRLVRRRYNQAAMLGQHIARLTGAAHCPDALLRPVRTRPLDGHSRAARFEALRGSIAPNPRRRHLIDGRPVCLIDDVMTSGATLAAATEACLTMGAQRVCILTLARVTKET